MKVFVTLDLTQDERDAIVIWLNIELRDRNLTWEYGTTLNNMFKRLVGRDHDVWEKTIEYKKYKESSK
jgi:hypothetical protein